MSIFDDVLAMKKQATDPFSTAASAAERSGFFGNIGRAAATGAGAGMAAAAVSGAGIAASKIYDAATKARDFRSMMGSSFNTDLHDYYRQNPRGFNEAYSSLRMMNPAFSKDPMVAGRFMREIMENRPEAGGGVLLNALQGRRDVPESPIFESFQRSGSSAAGSMMGELQKPHKLKTENEMRQEVELEKRKAEAKAKGGGGRGPESEGGRGRGGGGFGSENRGGPADYNG